MIRPLQEEVRSHLRSGVAITNLTQCVEELVLNSVDSGASSITVRIDLPNFKIQVSDNGSGIAFGDLKLVGERYSSSKCHVLKDLEQLTFYGFRGEALASVREICDVLEIVTRHRSSYQTYCKLFRNSQVLELTESRFPRTSSGTTVTIHNIFANLPVRQKSISETLDFERVRHRIASIALIHPRTAFLLINDSTGTKCLQTHICKSSVSTFSQLFGNHRSKGLQQVQFEHKDFKVSGFISTDTHHSKSLQFVFVNGHLLLKTKIHKLLNGILGKSELLRKVPISEVDSAGVEGYHTKATSPQNVKTVDKHGIFFLNIKCLVTEYDICLEPAKTMIEFQDWDSILYCVERCVNDFLINHNLISCSEQPESGEDDSSHEERSCRTTLEAFEYRREIETSNVKKSLHSLTVFRSRKAETGERGSGDKASSLKKGHAVSLLSDEKHKDNFVNDADGNDALISDYPNSDSNSSSNADVSHPIRQSLYCLDVTTKKLDKGLSSCTNENENKSSGGNHGNQVSAITTCRRYHVADSTTDTTLNSVKALGKCSNGEDCSSVDLLSTWSVSSHGVLDSQKTSTCQSGAESCNSMQRNLLNGFSNRNNSNNAFYSGAFIQKRIPCSSAVCLDKGKYLQTKNPGSDTLCRPDHEKVLTMVNSSFTKASIEKTRYPEASSTMFDKSRTKPMPTFTSPCPITLQGMHPRKRPHANKKTPALGSGSAAKNRRLITLKDNCGGKRIARYNRDSAGQYTDVENSEHNVQSAACCGQVVQRPVDDSIINKSPTTGESDIAGTSVCPEITSNSCINSNESVPGVTVSLRETCDSTVSFASNQSATHDSVSQVCLSKFEQHLETNSVISEAVSNLLNDTKPESVTDKYKEPLCYPLNKHQAAKEAMFEEKSNNGSESSIVRSNLPTGDNSDNKEKEFSSNREWNCTFDASLGRNLFINTRTGHSSFEPPNEFHVVSDDCTKVSVTVGTEVKNDHPKHVPHPVASHLSFSCTPWLPRENRRQQASDYNDGNRIVYPKDMSQLAAMYQDHQDIQGAEEKLCKWTDADTLKAYEQNLLNSGLHNSVAEMLDNWQNPVFDAPGKDILMANQPGGCIKNQITVYNVVHPYRFTKDMLAGMRVLRQLDDKFIVGILSQEDDDGLLVLVDQHAAHERVRLEHLQSELFEDGNNSSGSNKKPYIKSSPVCPPLEINLFAEEFRLLRTFQTEIERIGIRFVISQSKQVSGEMSLFVHGVPSVLVERELSEVKRGRPSVAVSKVKELIREHLDHVSMTCGVPTVIPKVISEVISSQACHGAVKFGESLGVSECQELIDHLSKCRLPFQCAHGRPSVIPLADLRFLGKKMTSQEVVCQPRMGTLRSALAKQH